MTGRLLGALQLIERKRCRAWLWWGTSRRGGVWCAHAGGGGRQQHQSIYGVYEHTNETAAEHGTRLGASALVGRVVQQHRAAFICKFEG